MILWLNDKAMKRTVPFFQYSRKERLGVLWLLGIFLFLWFLPGWLHRLFPPDLPSAEAPAEEETPVVEASDAPDLPIERFAFNPNTATESELLRLGMSERLVSSLIKFRERGGRFYRPEDLQKLYLMPDTLAAALMPFVHIPSSRREAAQPAKRDWGKPSPGATVRERPPPREVARIDINAATQADWEQLPGIGPAFAGRILRFREALGGFSSVQQVADTWRLPDTVFQRIEPWLVFSVAPSPLAINEVGVEKLAAHPYIKKWQAERLVRNREHYGPIPDWAGLQGLGIFKDEELQALRPYLHFHAAGDGNGD